MEDRHPEKKIRPPPKDFQPRGYQHKVFEVAMRRNTIAVLETGAGKTMIAVMLIKELGKQLAATGKKMLMVFLAPTVNLVHQQFEVARDYTELDVAEIFGAQGVGEWSVECWQNQVRTRDVVVMTPQILLDALRGAFLTLDTVRLIIFDECHRASGNHPYAKIMKEFYHSSCYKPSIFGLTASPIVGKGLSSSIGCEIQISKLEDALDSQVFTVNDRDEIEMYTSSAKIISKFYDANKVSWEDTESSLDSLRQNVDSSLICLEELPSNQFNDNSEILRAARKSLSNYHGKVVYCLNELGLNCAAEAVKICIENTYTLERGGCKLSKTTTQLLISFLKQALLIIEEFLPCDYEHLIKTQEGYAMGTDQGLISPKLDKLIEITQSFRSKEEACCLIFVQRIITAKVIERFMKKLSMSSCFSISYLTGGKSSKDALTPSSQRIIIDSFRAGKVNFLLTTDVAEEGIDIPRCSSTIRFDLPTTVHSYIQSRGRARQNGSCFILMLERGNGGQRDQITDIIRSEYSLRNFSSSRETRFVTAIHSEEKDAYSVESTGATVTLDSSVNIIYKYCDKLPKDRFFVPKPLFQLFEKDALHGCSLTLPPNAAFQKIVGPMTCSSNLAKQLVALDACKKLHQLGALSDHLLPFHEDSLDIKFAGSDECTSGAGTTKRKELHGMERVHALHGTWALEPHGATLNAYRIHFHCDQENENYSDFVLLLNSSLDDDIATAEIKLFLIPNKIVTSCISPCGKIYLTAEQVENSKLFQEFFFNGMFGSLFTGSKSSGVKREFLFGGHRKPWSSLKMYLLLPLEPSSGVRDTGWSIDWNVIYESISVVEYLKKIYSVDSESGNATTSTSVACETKCVNSQVIKLANKSLQVRYLKDLVVISIHNGKIYSVLDVIHDLMSDDPFDQIQATKHPQIVSFTDYYRQKYSIVLRYPQQPLLLLKQRHNPHNLLLSRSRFEGDSSGEKIVEKEQVHAHMPPELLVHINISTDLLKSFYLLPSIMHRLESLMLACQLRDEIAVNQIRIPISLILEAITTQRCCESFSSERLELLGDSVLKYALSCHLFLKYPTEHEGYLSDCRSQAVRNSTLHQLGTSRSLQGYIRDNAFDPLRWLAPGQISIHPLPCVCGVDTCNVPIERKYMTTEVSVVVGIPCDKGHRWMFSKTIADCVEALVGAYYSGGGLTAALSLIRWLGIDIAIDKVLVAEAKISASHLIHHSKVIEIGLLESKLSYVFSVKGLLLEAITHPSHRELGLDYCYQRLEFLGDSVLDLLITWHHFLSHKDVDPGVLTDLRSASVSNENFAQIAVRNNFDKYLQHGSGILSEKIKEYITAIANNQCGDDMPLPNGLPKAPKVLADIVESIAGAILIDTDLNVDAVWEIFKPLLSPIITPDNLESPPLRQLIELCSYLGYFIQTECISKGEEFVVQSRVQLKDDLLLGRGCDKNKRIAKSQAALCLLNQLEVRGKREIAAYILSGILSCSFLPQTKGISRDRCPPKRKKGPSISASNSLQLTANLRSSGYCSPLEENSYPKTKLDSPVTVPMRMEKGGPRTALFNLCKILGCPMPHFELKDKKFRTPVIVNGVQTPNFNLFRATVSLHIPNSKKITLQGEERTDKKTARDSAARELLLELEKQEICILENL